LDIFRHRIEILSFVFLYCVQVRVTAWVHNPNIWYLSQENVWASPGSLPAATWLWPVPSAGLDISAMENSLSQKEDLKDKNC
jgi:hypothetical protein